MAGPAHAYHKIAGTMGRVSILKGHPGVDNTEHTGALIWAALHPITVTKEPCSVAKT